MKPISFFFFFLGLSLHIWGDPRLLVKQPSHDFGEKPSGTLIQHEFILENGGDENLKIKNIKTSCGCTTTVNKTLVLQPGETKSLPIEMNLKGRSGKQSQRVTLTTNDPEHTTYTLKLSGEAVPRIRVEPRTLNLSQGPTSEIQQGDVKLTSTHGEKFTLTSVEASRNRLETEIFHADDGLSATIQVTPKPQEGQGHFTDVLLIKTSDPEVGEVRVLVMWQISTGITISPGVVKLNVSEESAVLNRYLLVRGHPGLEQPLEVTDVEWEGQDVEISVTENKNFGWRIHLKSFTPDVSMKDSELIIHTNAKGFETLKVPVQVAEK